MLPEISPKRNLGFENVFGLFFCYFRFIFRLQDQVKVWSGTYGVLSYPDVNGNDVDIYVYVKGDKKYIPAPKYYWKVLQNDVTGEAIAFVGLNDPHSKDILADQGFCNSVCSTTIG